MRGNGTAVWSRQSGGGDEGDCLFGYVLKPDRCSETRYPNIQKLDSLAHLKTATSSVVSDLHYYSLSSPLFPLVFCQSSYSLMNRASSTATCAVLIVTVCVGVGAAPAA